jgi:membrane protease YdiL (CAAX protease family)
MKKFITLALLFSEIGFAVILNYVLPFVHINYDYYLCVYISVLISYLCIVVWVWAEDNLEEFHIDRLSMVILIIFGLVRIDNVGIPSQIYFKIIIFILSIVLLMLFLKKYRRIPGIGPRWIAVSLLSCLLVIPLAFIYHLLKITPPANFMSLKQGFFWNASRNILFDLYFVAPFEEIIYRGFLWGQLRRWGLTEKKTFWVTMIVFWLIHIWEYPSTPYVFLILVPLTTLVFGALVYYSKRISTSIIPHTIYNALLVLIVQLFIH